MKLFLAFVVLLLAAGVTWAQPHVYAMDKNLATSRNAVSNALLSLSVSDSDWSIFVVPEKEWRSALAKGQHGHTAFTLPGKLTYINAQWIQDVHGDQKQIARVLAHEYGHIICGCAEEAIADTQAEALFHSR